MSDENIKNTKEMLTSVFVKELENYELDATEKQLFLDAFTKSLNVANGDANEEEALPAIKYMLDEIFFKLYLSKRSADLINECDCIDNKITKLKTFRRKVLKGDTAKECLNTISSWFELLNHRNFPSIFTDHLNELLSLDVEGIVALAKRHKLEYPGGINKLRSLLDEFKRQGCNGNTYYFGLMKFLCELASKVKNWPTPMDPQVETAHHYYNAKELIRLAEEDFSKEESSAKIAKYFFELGALYQGVMFAGHFSDQRVLKPLVDKMRSEICSSNQKKEAKIKFDKHLEYADAAWRAGCKLLHKQMGILLWVGVDNKSSSLNLLYKDIKRVAEPKFVQGGHMSMGRTESACPCPTGEHTDCPMIKILPPGSYFNVQGTHKSETLLKDCCLEYNSYREAKKAPLVPGECEE